MKKILKYVLLDLLRSRFIITYAVVLFILSFGISYFSNDITKTSLTLLNIILFIVPLVCLIFGAIHFYDSEEFVEMLLTQPLSRKTVFFAEYIAISTALSLCSTAGILPAIIYFGFSVELIILIANSIMLTCVFTALAFLSSALNSEKVRGVGMSILIWLFMAVIFDLIILLCLVLFRDYPLEKFAIILTTANPIDLARILVILKTDVTAMLGFTGAAFKEFFGGNLGIAASAFAMLMWIVAPFIYSLRVFNKKDF